MMLNVATRPLRRETSPRPAFRHARPGCPRDGARVASRRRCTACGHTKRRGPVRPWGCVRPRGRVEPCGRLRPHGPEWPQGRARPRGCVWPHGHLSYIRSALSTFRTPRRGKALPVSAKKSPSTKLWTRSPPCPPKVNVEPQSNGQCEAVRKKSPILHGTPGHIRQH